MKIPIEWNVFPIKEGSKFPPLLKEWETKCYPREELKNHKGNYGLGSGDISGGLVVFDWDFRKGRRDKGFKYIYELYKKEFPLLSDTYIVKTPNGYHFYYKLKGEKYRNTALKNCGYSSSLKKFYSTNQVKFSNYLSGLDTRANGGYVVIPPSKVKDGEYEWYNESQLIEITDEQYEAIFKWFSIDKKNISQNTIRGGFVDLLMGKTDPHTLKNDKNQEHVYWKELYHECWYIGGLLPEDLLKGLSKYQKGFDLEETQKQLNDKKNQDYIFSKSRLSKKKYDSYFNSKYNIEELLIESVKENDFTEIIYDSNKILHYSDRIDFLFIRNKKVIIQKILGASFSITRKVWHRNDERFTYILKDKKYYTDTILDIIRKAEPYLRKGLKGRDILKEVIEYYGSKLKNTKAKEFLGFDNEWILPQIENEKGLSIIAITDLQQISYEKTQKILKDYTVQEKEDVSKMLTEFIRITQAEPVNLAILIGWSIAGLFRLFFIQNYDLFPILYNYGIPGTGRSSLEDFWIVDFYGIYESHLPPTTTTARLEDHLSQAVYPHSFQDIKKEQINSNLISMLQDYSTSIGLFERKKSGKEIDFIKYKIAPLNLDSNYILPLFADPAINERQIFCNYQIKTVLDLDWLKLRKQLRQFKLFSFIYDYTKDWTNNNIEERFYSILIDFNSKFSTNSSRLTKSASIIKFGIELFKDIFNIPIAITDEKIMETIIKGSCNMTQEIVEYFREFCQLAINFDETYQYVKEYANGENHPSVYRGDNASYIHHKLRMDSDNEYYAYTSANHEDYKARYKEWSGMKSFVEKLHKGMSIKESEGILFTSARPFRPNGVKCKPMGIIKIYPSFFEDDNTDFDATKLVLTEEEAIKRYGEIPE